MAELYPGSPEAHPRFSDISSRCSCCYRCNDDPNRTQADHTPPTTKGENDEEDKMEHLWIRVRNSAASAVVFRRDRVRCTYKEIMCSEEADIVHSVMDDVLVDLVYLQTIHDLRGDPDPFRNFQNGLLTVKNQLTEV